MPNPAKLLTVGSESLTYVEWSKRPPYVAATTICSRLRLGWTPQEAVSIPTDRRFRPTTKPTKGAGRPCPRLRTHKASGQVYCEWVTAGERHIRYFGKAGTPNAEEGYTRFQLEWATRLVRREESSLGQTLLVTELVESWLVYCTDGDDGEGGYRKHGRLTSGIHAQRAAMNYLTPSHGTLGVDEFGPEELRAVRKSMVDAKLARRTINGYQNAIVQMFGWGVGRKLVPADVWLALKQVGRLQKGKTAARDNPKKRAVAWAVVETTLPHLHPRPARQAILEALVRLHWYVGGRPQDMVSMRPMDIERKGDVWRYIVDRHKNEHREQALEYWIGPKAQAILLPLLEGLAPESPIFAYPPLQESGQRIAIVRTVYGNRIKDACKRAGVSPWTPHQLRHSRATEVMRLFESDEAAGAAIGDTPEVARQVYVDDPRRAVARRIALATG